MSTTTNQLEDEKEARSRSSSTSSTGEMQQQQQQRPAQPISESASSSSSRSSQLQQQQQQREPYIPVEHVDIGELTHDPLIAGLERIAPQRHLSMKQREQLAEYEVERESHLAEVCARKASNQ